MLKRTNNNLSEPKASQTDKRASRTKKSNTNILQPISSLPVIKDLSTPKARGKFIKTKEGLKSATHLLASSRTSTMLPQMIKEDEPKKQLRIPSFSIQDDSNKSAGDSQVKLNNRTHSQSLLISIESACLQKYSEDILSPICETKSPKNESKDSLTLRQQKEESFSKTSNKDFLNQSSSQTLNIDSLKSRLKISEEKYSKLEANYQNDSNSLKKEIEHFRNEIKRLLAENDNLKAKVESLTKQAEEQAKLNQSKFLINYKENAELQEILKEKSCEITQLGDMVKKNYIEKREREDFIKNLQNQISTLQSENKAKSESYLTIQKNLGSITEEYEREKTKYNKTKQKHKNFKDILETNNILEAKFKETSSCLNFVNGNLKDMKITFTKYKEKAEETEQSLKAQILKYQSFNQDTSSLNWIKEKAKIRKNLTLTSLSSKNNQEQDVTQLNNKISYLEKQVDASNQQIAKMNRDLQYYKQQLEDKCKLIEKIETRMQEMS